MQNCRHSMRAIRTGLPDGLFSNQKSQIWVNFGGLLNGKCLCILWLFGIFLWPFGTIYGRLVLFVVICYIFPVLVCLDQEKIWQPWIRSKYTSANSDQVALGISWINCDGSYAGNVSIVFFAKQVHYYERKNFVTAQFVVIYCKRKCTTRQS
jgi:hypothetical protein